MLESLDIKGLATIDQLRINFSKGFNVITGETGAGKSVLIKALCILLGYKTGKDSIRSGTSQAFICAQFKLDCFHPAVELLDELSLPYEVDSKTHKIFLIIRRSFSETRSQCWINDTPVTNSTIKKIAPHLVDIFAQNESNQLLDNETHLKYLDKFIPSEIKQKVSGLYETSMSYLKQIQSLSQDYKNKNKDKDYLQFRTKEFDSFNPSVQDYEELKSYCESAQFTYEKQKILQQAQSVLDSSNSQEPVSSLFWKLSKDFLSIIKHDESTTQIQQLKSESENIAERIDQLSYSVSKLISDSYFDPLSLQEKEQRISEYQDLFRKFSVNSVEELIEAADRLKDSLTNLEKFQTDLCTLIDSLYQSTLELDQTSKDLSSLRHKTGSSIIKKIEQELHSLSMPHAKIDLNFIQISSPKSSVDLSFIELSKSYQDKLDSSLDILSKHNETGREKLSFLLSANKGEKLLALNKVASGGEISRIMLALKHTLSIGADTCVLIFDEIDTGISGKVADLVGRKLKQLSLKFQVFCISHLAQVAVYADTHFLVRKEENARTSTSIIKLSDSESIKEIARLLSGESITQSSLENATNLKQKASTTEII